LIKKINEKKSICDYLESCLAYLEVNQRQLALGEIENCIMIDETDPDLIVLHALIYWSLLELSKGYKLFWNAYSLEKTNTEVILFIQMITPELEKLYK
jgi:Tfp pilus assembly protein PilF